MIRIEKIEIEEFRGIRKLTITPNQKNLGISGPNGTGKSGVVDAVEFALTGSITRLAGRGTSDISVKQHAAHVDFAKKSDESIVRLTVKSLDGGKQAVIERSVGTPHAPKITTTDIKLQKALEELAVHPEFALSRREIVKYILTPPGQRAKDVQELLRLDQIEKVRTGLQRIANDTAREEKLAQQSDDGAKADLLKALDLAKLSKAELLKAVNDRRKLLGLAPIEDLTSTTDLSEGVVGGAAKEVAKLHKTTAVTELSDFLKELGLGDSESITKHKQDATAVLTRLTEDAALLTSLRRQALVQQGLKLVIDPACPLCDIAWDMDALKAYLQKKLVDAKEADDLLKAYSAAVGPISVRLSDLEARVRKLMVNCSQLEPKIDSQSLQQFADARKTQSGVLQDFTGSPDKPPDCQGALDADCYALTDQQSATLTTLAEALAALPDPTKEEEAKQFLFIAQEKLARSRLTKAELDAAAARRKTAADVLEAYATISTMVLEGVYAAVEDDFTKYYSAVNHDDEKQFDGKLKPSLGKLAFDVDFYGRGLFPPGAYHSEGHQDGMGLCLYLALMKHTLGDKFTVCVLDDVLMSVDAGHRREVCRLLRTEFPKTQFILTTHDPVWLQFMKTENLVGSSISFGGWSVENGPNVWEEGDVWKKIEDRLAKNDVPGAASTLRRYLEFAATIIATNLRAPVDFQSDGQYDLGDLLPPAIGQHRKLLAAAKEAAISWGQADAVKPIEEVEKNFKAKAVQSQAEQWMINKAVHYNEWHNLQKAEFEAVVAAFKALLGTMRCTEALCMEYVRVVPRKGAKQALRCDCGKVNFNLKKK